MPLFKFPASGTYVIASQGTGTGDAGYQVIVTPKEGWTGSVTLQQNTAPAGATPVYVSVPYQNADTAVEVAAGTAITTDAAVIVSPTAGDLIAVVVVTAGAVNISVNPASLGVTNNELMTAFEAAGYSTAGQDATEAMLSVAVADMLGRSLDVRAFGAIGDGVTDDTAAIQAALTAAMEQGRTVTIPSATFAVPSWTTFVVTAPLTIMGTGAATLTGDVALTCLDIRSAVTMRGVAFASWGTACSFESIPTSSIVASFVLQECRFDTVAFPVRMRGLTGVTGVADVDIADCTMQAFTRGIEFAGVVRRATVQRVDLTTGTSQGIVLGADSDTLTDSGDSERITVRDCALRGIVSSSAGANGILVYGRDVVVDGNYLDNINNVSGTDCKGIYVNATYAVVTNNILRNAGRADGAIDLKGVWRGETSSSGNGWGIVVSHNRIVYDDARTEGRGIDIAAEDVQIVDNYFKGCTGPAIVTRAVLAGRNFAIRGNVFKNCDSTGSADARLIQARLTGANLDIADNIVDGCRVGSGGAIVFIENRNATVASQVLDNVRVRGNTIADFDVGDAIRIAAYRLTSGDPYNTFGAVEFANNLFENGSRGIVSGSNISSSSFESLTIADNIFDDVTSPTISLSVITAAASAYSVRDNTGLVTRNRGTATVVNGATTVAVSHGLILTPALTNIMVTPTNNLGSATKFWVSTPTASQFTINVDANPGASTATFVWSASLQ